MSGHQDARPSKIHDVVAIGLGPFNLGLACLADPVEELDAVFLEAAPEFDWHPGMMLEDATLQVPFLADLVTMADPTSRFSFLNFLKDSGHLYSFYIRESFYPLRREFNDYCRWAAARARGIRFDQRVTTVEHAGDCYVVSTATDEFRARRLVLGTGTQPVIPPACREAFASDPTVLHTSAYLHRKEELQRRRSIAVVGSGQSAAEVYADLLSEIDVHGYSLTWVTRSPRFFPMEYTKLTLELTSPEYSGYFRTLTADQRQTLLRDQRSLYKGISGDLVDGIFDLLYQKRVAHREVDTTLITNTEVTGLSGGTLRLHHREADEHFELDTEAVVLATGYAATVPEFLEPVRERIRWDDRGRYDVADDYAIDRHGGEIFVQNAEEHTHGFVAPDLGMGAMRNSVILGSLLGRSVYPVEKRIAFQDFGVPDRLRRVSR